MFIRKTVQSFTLLLLLILSAPTYAELPTWEYFVETYLLTGDDEGMTRAFNELGREHWELVNCIESNARMVCTFKRLVEE